MARNPGAGARRGSAAAASETQGETEAPAESSKIIGVGIRMPEGMHEELRLIAFNSRSSLNSLLVEGAQRIIHERSPLHGSKSQKK